MDILRIIFRIGINFLKEVPVTPHRLRLFWRLRRRIESRRAFEADRLNRIRYPSKYRGR